MLPAAHGVAAVSSICSLVFELYLQVLGELVEKSGYSPQAAAELHKQLYRQKLNQLVAKKKITADEQEDLKRIRRILCIPADMATQVRVRRVDVWLVVCLASYLATSSLHAGCLLPGISPFCLNFAVDVQYVSYHISPVCSCIVSGDACDCWSCP